jgi:hypothetical protein
MASRRLKKSESFIKAEMLVKAGSLEDFLIFLELNKFKKVELNKLLAVSVDFNNLDIFKFLVKEKKLNYAIRDGVYLENSINMNSLDIMNYLVDNLNIFNEISYFQMSILIRRLISFDNHEIIESFFKFNEFSAMLLVFDKEYHSRLTKKVKIKNNITNF